MFTEDYQVEFLPEYHLIFDTARKENLMGEMVWNFADFMTGQSKNGPLLFFTHNFVRRSSHFLCLDL